MKLESRHWVFLGLFVGVFLAMVAGWEYEVTVSANTQDMFDYLDSMPEGSPIIISFDHEASSLPEIRPLALVILRHAFKKNHKLIGVALLAEGTVIGYRLMEETAAEYGKRYGEDFAYLGFKPQYIAAVLSMGESLPATYPQDYLGNRYEDLAVLDSIENYDDVAGVISIADGSLTTHWMEYAAAQYGVRISAAVTAAMVTTYDPYLSTGQMHAMIGGLRGAAEYERLLQIRGSGNRGMLAQTATHLYVLALVLLGNAVWLMERRRRKT
jgi:hypothetical protein